MTREEFLAGWMLLTIQPWGRKYGGQDSTAKLQFEFYWSRLEKFHGEAWKGSCQLFAGGDKWPSVDEIRNSINNSLPPRFQVTYAPDMVEKTELQAKIDIYRDQHNCTMLEAAEAVLPEFAKANPGPEADEQIDECEKLIKSLKAHRASMQVLKQEREALKA